MEGQDAFSLQQQQLQEQQSHAAALQHRGIEAQNLQYRQEIVNKLKRPPPTPAGTSLASTPLGTPHAAAGFAGQGQQTTGMEDASGNIAYIQMDTLEDATAIQVTAGQMNININDEHSLQAFLQAPAPSTMGDLLKTVRAYHTAVIRPELRQVCMQMDKAVQNLNEAYLQQRQEFNWLAADSREMQKQRAAVQVILQGFPTTMLPKDRYPMVEWMLQKTKEVADYALQMKSTTHTALLTEPVTVRAGQGWSKASILTFRSHDLRQAFLREHGRANKPLWSATGAVPGAHIRTTPAIPPFQRRIESVMWVFVNALNMHESIKDKHMTVLWRCGAIMQPQATKEWQDGHTAILRFGLTNNEMGAPLLKVFVKNEYSEYLQYSPTGNREDSNFYKAWNEQFYGHEAEMMDLDTDAASAARRTAGEGKGQRKGAGRHWLAGMCRMDVDDQNRLNPMPLPLELTRMPDEETIDFDQKEYNNKMGRPDLNKSAAAAAAAAAAATDGAAAAANTAATAAPAWPLGGSSSLWGAGGK
jgi:hypothetical protein